MKTLRLMLLMAFAILSTGALFAQVQSPSIKKKVPFVMETRSTAFNEYVNKYTPIYCILDTQVVYIPLRDYPRTATINTILATTGGYYTMDNNSLAPVRSTGEYWYAHSISGGTPFSSVTPAKTYMYYVSATRASGQTMTGDSRDVLFKGAYSNYGANDASSQFQGIGVSGRNRSGGTFGTMNAGEFGINNSSGATLTTAYGGTFTIENYGTLSTTMYGVKIDLRNEGAKATTEYGLYVTNTNNSLGTAADAAIKVADAGANIGWGIGLDLNGATMKTDIKLHTGVVIASGTAADDGAIKAEMGYTAAPGSIWISTAGAGTVWIMLTTTWTNLIVNP